jgi:hypothetical protein
MKLKSFLANYQYECWFFCIQYSFGFNKALLTRFMIFLAVQTSCLPILPAINWIIDTAHYWCNEVIRLGCQNLAVDENLIFYWAFYVASLYFFPFQ